MRVFKLQIMRPSLFSFREVTANHGEASDENKCYAQTKYRRKSAIEQKQLTQTQFALI